MTAEDRLGEIATWLEAVKGAWPLLSAELERRIAEHTTALISADNEQTRGRIKALRELLELPKTLDDERQGISAGLSESDPAD